MNILHLIETSEPGGAEAVFLSLVAALRERGHHSFTGLLEAGWLSDHLKEAGFEPIFLEQKRSYDLRCLWNLCLLIRKYRIDLIHAHEFMMNVYGSAAGLIENRPVITTVHGKNYYGEKSRRRVAYRFVSRFSRMVAVSEDLKSFLAGQIGISKRRIVTLHNGIECGKFGPHLSSGSLTSLKESLSIPIHNPVIGIIGMLFPVKDHSTFLNAAREVIKELPTTIFLIIGEGPVEDQLKAEAFQLGIDRNVRFAGLRNDVPALLQIIDVYVCSSLSEGLSLSILEAMAAGKPVVATDVGGNPEIVIDGETGFLVPPKDAKKLALKIALLVKDTALGYRLGAKARKRVQGQFSVGSMVDSYLDLYKQVLSPRKKGGPIC